MFSQALLLAVHIIQCAKDLSKLPSNRRFGFKQLLPNI